MIDKGQCWDLARTPGLLFMRSVMGFLMTTETQDPRFERLIRKTVLFYSIVSQSLHWGVRTHTDCRVSTPCWSH